jgi:hypothetical protein
MAAVCTSPGAEKTTAARRRPLREPDTTEPYGTDAGICTVVTLLRGVVIVKVSTPLPPVEPEVTVNGNTVVPETSPVVVEQPIVKLFGDATLSEAPVASSRTVVPEGIALPRASRT